MEEKEKPILFLEETPQKKKKKKKKKPIPQYQFFEFEKIEAGEEKEEPITVPFMEQKIDLEQDFGKFELAKLILKDFEMSFHGNNQEIIEVSDHLIKTLDYQLLFITTKSGLVQNQTSHENYKKEIRSKTMSDSYVSACNQIYENTPFSFDTEFIKSVKYFSAFKLFYYLFSNEAYAYVPIIGEYNIELIRRKLKKAFKKIEDSRLTIFKDIKDRVYDYKNKQILENKKIKEKYGFYEFTKNYKDTLKFIINIEVIGHSPDFTKMTDIEMIENYLHLLFLQIRLNTLKKIKKQYGKDYKKIIKEKLIPPKESILTIIFNLIWEGGKRKQIEFYKNHTI